MSPCFDRSIISSCGTYSSKPIKNLTRDPKQVPSRIPNVDKNKCFYIIVNGCITAIEILQRQKKTKKMDFPKFCKFFQFLLLKICINYLINNQLKFFTIAKVDKNKCFLYSKWLHSFNRKIVASKTNKKNGFSKNFVNFFNFCC